MANSHSFTLLSTCPQTRARAGLLQTHHGPVPTPAFMPVATQASVKTLTPQEVREVGATIVLSNTYHLYLRPGAETVHRLGGLHRFMGWDGPILTDSGGFQAFSLGTLRRVSDEGVLFRSHIDGSEHFFTPQASIRYQELLGADVIMCLDQCIAYGESEEEVRRAMERTHRWALACRQAHQRPDQALFGIVQGGVFPHLRQESARYLVSLDFPGYAVGGLAVGESKATMYQVLDWTEPLLPADKPRYLMGVGAPDDLVECVARGMDLFDSALPTRVARNGALFTPSGRADITKAQYREQQSPVQDGCDCYTCRHFSAAYLHHLFRARELLGLRLASIHNLRFVLRLMEEMRQAILEGTFPDFREQFLARYQPTDEEARLSQKARWMEERGLLTSREEN